MSPPRRRYRSRTRAPQRSAHPGRERDARQRRVPDFDGVPPPLPPGSSFRYRPLPPQTFNEHRSPRGVRTAGGGRGGAPGARSGAEPHAAVTGSMCSVSKYGSGSSLGAFWGGMEAIASQMGNGRDASSSPNSKQELQPYQGSNTLKPNQVGETSLYGVPIVSLVIDGQERLCLAQISNTLLKNYSYNEIHNRRVALGITCVQCTPVQLEILRRAGAMPISSRRCGMITKREAERLCKSFLGEHKPPKLPENFAFDVVHECAWGSRGSFIPARYNSSRAKCIKCSYCSMYFSPNKFIFHSHRTPDSKYTQPDAANFNSWRRHLKLSDKTATEELSHAWEDVKAMFNGGTRKRTFSLQGAAAGGPGAGSPAAKAALHPPPPAGPELAAATAVVVAAAAAAAAAAAEPAGLAGRHGELEGSEPSGSGRSSATPQEGAGGEGERCPSALSRAAGEEERSGDEALLAPLPLPRKGSYLSAFRPVVKDAESIAKLYGTREAFGGAGPRGPGYLSPDFLSEGSSSYRSLSPGGDTAEEPEVDVESNRFPEDEEEESAAVPAAAVPSEGREPPRLLAGPEEPPPAGADGPEEKTGEVPTEGGPAPDGSPERSSSSGGAYEVFAPERGEPLQPLKPAASLGAPAAFLCTPEAKEQDKEDNHSAAEDLETRKSYQDQRNVSHPSPVNTDRGEEGLAMDVTGTQLVEKDIENLARDELQKLVLEQMELRKKLERDFQSLKDNFQDQMKRELAYREEMVQQLQIVRDTLCNELDQERKARYAIQQKLKEAHDALHHFSCKMLTPRHCTGNCSFKPPLLPQ
ncbi:SKI family transcriptional corepressor 1 [Corapipo altera]|uniref:SKI family transcriptional corepressor 1 n=1 Tax=Corapipo altera TaxID=415028 RepID=UPI000FD67C7B|nr:SKI family transcriptional corepressor 1 [Corapipo altera]